MNEGCGVDDLDDGTEADGSDALVAEHFGGEQKERGPETLASALTQVFADLGNGLYIRHAVSTELGLDGRQVFPEKVEDLFTLFAAAAKLFKIEPLLIRIV